MLKKDIVILGAGMVGVCSALALQKKGLNVTLIDSGEVGAQTSFGNAGMITPSSIIPFNNPKIFKSLPYFLANKSAGFRYNYQYALQELSSLVQFLSFARPNSTQYRIKQLYQLIERSIELHRQQASNRVELRDRGWLRLYREASSLEKSKYDQAIFEQYNVNTKRLNRTQLLELEPHLKDVYHGAIHICDALSVASPTELVKAYAEQFCSLGGLIQHYKIEEIHPLSSGWRLVYKNNQVTCQNLVIATGPWSKQLLSKLSLNLPMIFERGGHREYCTNEQNSLHTPIHDVDGSFVATPCNGGIRLSCGVELNKHNAKPSNAQLDIIEVNARQGMEFETHYRSQWHGARPTMPDSLPVIGETKLKGLWLNTGHQHIGFSTGLGSAEILADLMMGQTTQLDADAYSPKRFKI